MTTSSLLRRLAASAAAVLLAAVPLALASPASADPTEGACAPGQGVTVVVDGLGGGGGVETRCAPGDPVNGIQALRAAGFQLVTGTFGIGEYVCIIGAVGNACDAPFDGSYWAFWTADPTAAWESSAVGASDVDPVPGDVHGWSWGPGTEPSVPSPAAGPERPVTTGTPNPQASADAAAYLAGTLVDGAVVGPFGPDYGLTTDAAFGLLAAGTQDAVLDEVLTRLEQDAALFAHGQQFAADGERPDAVYAGQTAKLGLVALLTGGDPTDVGGLDLVTDLQSTEAAGRYTDISAFGDVSNVFSQALGVLLLAQADGVAPSPAAIQVLLDAQCADGGFPVFLGQTTCASDADATGLALQALSAVDLPAAEQPAAEAVSYLLSVQLASGAFESGTTGTGDGNVNTTGYAAMGLAAAGQDVSSAVTWLSSLLSADGGLPVTPGGPSDGFATSQALPALTADSLVSAARVVPRASDVPDPEPTTPTPPTPSPTTPPTTPADPGATPTGGVLPTSTSTSSSAGAPVRPGVRAGADARPGALARTGTEVLAPVALGGGLLLAGAAAVVATRRRRPGAHR